MADWEPQNGEQVIYNGRELFDGPRKGSIGIVVKKVTTTIGAPVYVVRYPDQPQVNGLNGPGTWQTYKSSINPLKDTEERVIAESTKRLIAELVSKRDEIDAQINKLVETLPKETEVVGPAIRHLDLDD